MSAQYDLIVIGAGPAGAQAASQAAAWGKRVALVEREPYLGGAGLTTGTMPSKMLREAAVTLTTLQQRGLPALQYALRPGTRLIDLMYQKSTTIEAAWSLIERNVERQNIRVVRGRAAFHDGHTVTVIGSGETEPTSETLAGEIILVATGSTSIHPTLFPFDHPQIKDAESILTLEYLPRSLAIVGAGTIGCEYASIFQALGVHVTLIEKHERLLRAVDLELAKRWQQHLERQGAQFCLADEVTQVALPASGQAGDVRLSLASGQTLAAEVVLVSVGRRGNVAGLNLQAAGLTANEDGIIAVNENFQTSVPHIYAAGDVVGWPALASTSMEQARLAMKHAFEHSSASRGGTYPVAVYTIPEIAKVGLTEEACQQYGVTYAVGRANFATNTYAQLTGDTSGLMKLVFDPKQGKLLGVQIMCAGAADLIQLGVQILATGGQIDAFTRITYSYPTLSEAYRVAALDGLDHLRRKAESDLGN